MNCGTGYRQIWKSLGFFGTVCFAHIPAEDRRKLDNKANKGKPVGYLDDGRGKKCNIEP